MDIEKELIKVGKSSELDNFIKAEQLSDAGQYGKAIKVYEKISKKCGKYSKIMGPTCTQIGINYAKMRDYLNALTYTRQALKLNPKLEGANSNFLKLKEILGTVKEEEITIGYLSNRSIELYDNGYRKISLNLMSCAIKLEREQRNDDMIEVTENECEFLIEILRLSRLDPNIMDKIKNYLENKNTLKHIDDAIELNRISESEYLEGIMKGNSEIICEDKKPEQEETKQMNPYMEKILQGLWFAFDYNYSLGNHKKEKPDWKIEE